MHSRCSQSCSQRRSSNNNNNNSCSQLLLLLLLLLLPCLVQFDNRVNTSRILILITRAAHILSLPALREADVALGREREGRREEGERGEKSAMLASSFQQQKSISRPQMSPTRLLGHSLRFGLPLRAPLFSQSPSFSLICCPFPSLVYIEI